MGFLASSAAAGSNHSGGSTQSADGVVISKRQYFVAGLGDGDGVFPLGGQLMIFGHNRPLVWK